MHSGNQRGTASVRKLKEVRGRGNCVTSSFIKIQGNLPLRPGVSTKRHKDGRELKAPRAEKVECSPFGARPETSQEPEGRPERMKCG